jgi:hypothetical protein
VPLGRRQFKLQPARHREMPQRVGIPSKPYEEVGLDSVILPKCRDEADAFINGVVGLIESTEHAQRC